MQVPQQCFLDFLEMLLLLLLISNVSLLKMDDHSEVYHPEIYISIILPTLPCDLSSLRRLTIDLHWVDRQHPLYTYFIFQLLNYFSLIYALKIWKSYHCSLLQLWLLSASIVNDTTSVYHGTSENRLESLKGIPIGIIVPNSKANE